MITPVMINFIGAIEQLWPLSVMTCTNIFFIGGLSEPFCGGYEKEQSWVSQNTHTRQVSFHGCHRKDRPLCLSAPLLLELCYAAYVQLIGVIDWSHLSRSCWQTIKIRSMSAAK